MSVLSGSTDVVVFRSSLEQGGWLCRKIHFEGVADGECDMEANLPRVAPWDDRCQEPFPDGSPGGPEMQGDSVLQHALLHYTSCGAVMTAATRGRSPDIHEFALASAHMDIEGQFWVHLKDPRGKAEGLQGFVQSSREELAGGSVWLCFPDFTAAFGCVTVCRLTQENSKGA
eukprot:4852847-Amphidinium_carterae.1